MTDQPRPSVEFDLEEAIKKIKQLEASTAHLRRRYDELHTSYRQQEQELDRTKVLMGQDIQRIGELEEMVRRLGGQNEARAAGIPLGHRRMTDEDNRHQQDQEAFQDMLAHKLLPKWMEATRERVQQMGRR
jgi:chromosome segregation ATPase